ncbi:heme-binding protein, partial [Rhizobium ruizarguesonis]
GAIKASIDISTRKARTSILMNAPTSALMGLVQPGAELYGLEQLSGGLVIFGGGLLLDASIEGKSFLGRGQCVRLSAGGGQEGSRAYGVSFTEPYFLDYHL